MGKITIEEGFGESFSPGQLLLGGRLFRMTESDELNDSLDGGKKTREDLDKIRRWLVEGRRKGTIGVLEVVVVGALTRAGRH